MPLPTSPATSLVPALQTATRDTVVTVVARDGLAIASEISVVILGVFLLVLLVVLGVLLRQLAGLNRTVRSLGSRALDKADPIVERGKGVADNVEFISAAVRDDVERLSRTVKGLTDRLQQASDRMEERIEEFNALMEVVQDEAEEIFVSTASTARGVRRGVDSLAPSGTGEEPSHPDGGSGGRGPSGGRSNGPPPDARGKRSVDAGRSEEAPASGPGGPLTGSDDDREGSP